MDKKNLKILPIIILLIVLISVYRGNGEANKDAQISVVRSYIEAINDKDVVYAKKYILEDTNKSTKLINTVEKGNEEELEVITINKSKIKFKPIEIMTDSNDKKIYKNGINLEVKYVALQKYQSEKEMKKKFSRIYTLVEVNNGVYKIYDIK